MPDMAGQSETALVARAGLLARTWARSDFRGTIHTDEIEWAEHDASLFPEES